jgi:hypothetical protein
MTITELVYDVNGNVTTRTRKLTEAEIEATKGEDDDGI